MPGNFFIFHYNRKRMSKKETLRLLDEVKALLLKDNKIKVSQLKKLNDHLELILSTPANEALTIEETDSVIEIWSDGACSGNPGPGGWGTIVMLDGSYLEFSDGSPRTTNNIMEMTGALEGIKKTPAGSKIILTSDSQYLVKGMTQWLKNWKKKNWKKADGKEVLNKDLWKELDKEASKRQIEWVWVKGHAGHPENERCDELAREAISQFQ